MCIHLHCYEQLLACTLLYISLVQKYRFQNITHKLEWHENEEHLLLILSESKKENGFFVSTVWLRTNSLDHVSTQWVCWGVSFCNTTPLHEWLMTSVWQHNNFHMELGSIFFSLGMLNVAPSAKFFIKKIYFSLVFYIHIWPQLL